MHMMLNKLKSALYMCWFQPIIREEIDNLSKLWPHTEDKKDLLLLEGKIMSLEMLDKKLQKTHDQISTTKLKPLNNRDQNEKKATKFKNKLPTLFHPTAILILQILGLVALPPLCIYIGYYWIGGWLFSY